MLPTPHPLFNSFCQPSSTFILVIAFIAVLMNGCGTSGTSGPHLSGNTEVTVMLTSTGNDQLQSFQIGLSSITLTSQSGKTVNLLTTSTAAEFMHINGGAEPLVTVSIPQDVYTAAASPNLSTEFECATFVPPNTIDTNTIGDPFGGPNATISFPSPITITGESMFLSLNLQVSKSVTLSSCYNPNGPVQWTFTPTFTLTPLTLSAQPTNPENGEVSGVHGEITSIDTANGGFTISLSVEEGFRTLSISSNTATVYQGISDFAALSVGTFVDMDGAAQPDGTLLATRIAVEDTGAVNVITGPVELVNGQVPVLNMLLREEEGASFSNQEILGGGFPFNFSNATFQISGQLANLQNLPFTPSFNASNIIDGQNIYLSAPAIPTGGPPLDARTITLIPQTIDGTVSATNNAGSFAVYTVTLAPYDLFPDLTVAPNQQSYLINPNQVEVYVDSNTQMLNSTPVTVGNTLRFYGLIFNDGGTLQMDCAQINDGVAE